MEQTNFTFKYTGTSEIDVNVLINSLQSVSDSLKEISRTETGHEIGIKIQPFKEGSFEWVFALMQSDIVGQASVFAGMLTGDGIIEKFKNAIELVKFFGSKDINEGVAIGNNQYQFTNRSGEVKIIEGDNVNSVTNYNGTVINIENLIIQADNTQSIQDMVLLDKNKKEITSIKKEDIKRIAKAFLERNNIEEPIAVEQIKEPRNINKKSAVISISKPDLAGKTMWKVIYEGNPINVKIYDITFLKDVNQRKYSFYNGTELIVDLIIHQVYDNNLRTYKNSSYSVSKFHSLREENNPPELFD